jgi:hypothetical protein
LAQGQIIATSSLPVDNGFWDSELGSRYLEMQEEAIARGVRVRRVFILAGARPEPDPTVERIRALQQEKRIEVRFLDIDVLTVGQRRLYKDYVLVDSRVYYQVQPPSRRWGDDESGSAVVETLLSVRAPEVEFARDYFEQLWKLAGGSSIP